MQFTFYNSLNYNVNEASQNTKSGLSMMNFLNGSIPEHHKNIGGCSGTKWGCCPDRITPKYNSKGSNCIHEQQCPTIAEPVCGTNNKTYLNGCTAKMMGTKVAYPSACLYTENFSNSNKNCYNNIVGIIVLLIIIVCIFILTR